MTAVSGEFLLPLKEAQPEAMTPNPTGNDCGGRWSFDANKLADRLASCNLEFGDELNDILKSLFSKHCNGYAGQWRFYKASGADDQACTNRFRCLRMYRTTETEPPQAEYFNLYEEPPESCSTRLRQQDGLYENTYRRPLTDSYFAYHMHLTEEERKENKPACLYWRFVAVDKTAYARIAPALPPKPSEELRTLTLMYPGWTPRNIVSGVWAMEAFFQDGPWRWSMGPLYSIRNLQLISHFCIQEYATGLAPEDPVDFEKQPWKEARPRLNSAVETWLANGTWGGEMTELIWDEDGEMIRLPSRPACWTPPFPDTASHQLLLYPDSLYAYYPKKLPDVRKTSATSFLKGNKFPGCYMEVGGLMRSQQEFRRLILRFNLSGEALSLTQEVYRPSSSNFAFQKREIISVRGAADLNRARSNQSNMSGSFTLSHSSAGSAGLPSAGLPRNASMGGGGGGSPLFTA